MTARMILSAAAALLVLPAAASADTRIVANCFFPPQHFVCRDILKGWGDEVERVTEGRVRVNLPAKSMAPPPEQLASVQGGVFDAALQFNGFIARDVPGIAVSLQPFANGSDAHANSLAFWRTYEKFVAGKETVPGAQLLGVFAAPGADFFSLTDTPIATLDDIKARKMWALPGVTADIVKGLGSAAVSGPAVQMTEIVQRGVVDGFVGIPDSDAKAYNLLPYVKSVTQTKAKIFAPTFSLFISDAKWAEIDPADQQAIQSVSGEAFAERGGTVWAKAEAEAVKELSTTATVETASDAFEAGLHEAAAPFEAAWAEAATAKGIDAKGALDFYRQTVADLTGK